MALTSTLSHWSLDPSVGIGVAVAAVLYWRGWRSLGIVRSGRRVGALGHRRWNALAFYAGLLIVVIALESPIDWLSPQLFTFHMLQHLLLIMAGAPLLVLGDPAMTLLRGLPLSWRRRSLGFAARRSWIERAGRRLAWVRSPRTIFAVFIADLYLWHWSWLYDLTLQNNAVHLIEHASFLLTSLLFWSQVIDQRGMPARLSYARRAAYLVFTAAASNILALYLVFAPKAVYPWYAHLTSRPFGMSALGDQQIAGALMWVPVLMLFGGAFAVCLFKALGEDERRNDALEVTGAAYNSRYFSSDAANAATRRT